MSHAVDVGLLERGAGGQRERQRRLARTQSGDHARRAQEAHRQQHASHATHDGRARRHRGVESSLLRLLPIARSSLISGETRPNGRLTLRVDDGTGTSQARPTDRKGLGLPSPPRPRTTPIRHDTQQQQKRTEEKRGEEVRRT